MNIRLKQVTAFLCAAGVMSIPSITFAEEPRHANNNTAATNTQDNARTIPDTDVPGRSFVSIGPYVGLPYSYSGSNLIVNSPSVNTDVQLLTVYKDVMKYSHEKASHDFTKPHPHLLLSGIIESQAIFENLNGSSSSDIDLTNVSLDVLLFGPGNWILGFIEFSHDNSPTALGTFRISHSRVYVNKAFVTIGNFAESPFYGTVGQYYVPFGTYSSAMVSDPFTKLLARTKARAVTVGFQEQNECHATYGALYVFRGDTGPHNNRINNGGFNLGYKFKTPSMQGNVGAGMIANMADSVGIQSAGLSASPMTEALVHRVPAYNLRGSLSIGERIDLIGEWIGASRRFSPVDMTYNSHGAQPWALHLEGLYSFTLGDKPSTIGLGVGRTGQALAINLPETRYSAVFTTSLLQQTLQSIEFRRDHFYGSSQSATIAGGTSIVGNGYYDNVVTLQFDYYF